MQRLISLWKNESKNGGIYYTGKIGETSIVAFENNNKTNEKQPDLTLYVREEIKKEGKKAEKQENSNEVDPFQEFGEAVEQDNLLD